MRYVIKFMGNFLGRLAAVLVMIAMTAPVF